MSADLTTTFHASVDKGRERLNRSLPGLLATGAVGGIDNALGGLGFVTVLRLLQVGSDTVLEDRRQAPAPSRQAA